MYNKWSNSMCCILTVSYFLLKLPPPIECLYAVMASALIGISDRVGMHYSTVTATACLTDGPASATIQNNLQTLSAASGAWKAAPLH